MKAAGGGTDEPAAHSATEPDSGADPAPVLA
jgi:hypothetical protein